MIYRPTNPALRLWDTWMFRDGRDYHIFTLTQPASLSYWDRVCHAVSRDLVHWEEWDEIILEEKENKAAWDAGVILTGSTFKCDSGYGMTYGAVKEKSNRPGGDDAQRIGVLFSKDLRTWTKCAANPVLSPRGPYYEDDPARTAEGTVAWRDAYVMPCDGGYEALICANDASKMKTVNGCIARVTSKDLIHWEIHPPIASPGRYVDMEVPQYFELGGRHYLLFSTCTVIDTGTRTASRGTYYLMADSKYGPYRVPEENFLIGSGELRFDCYVGKAFFNDEGPLLYHHICGKRTAFAAPKALQQGPNGELHVERWKGLDMLLGKRLADASSTGSVATAQHDISIGNWKVSGGRLTGDAGPAASGWLFDAPVADCALRARMDLKEAECAGVLLHVAPVEEPRRRRVRGLAVRANRKRGVIQLCEVETNVRRSVEFKALDNVYGQRCDSCDIEVFMRAEYIEVYCNRRALFVLNAGDYPVSGKLGFFVERGRASFDEVRVTEVPPMR